MKAFFVSILSATIAFFGCGQAFGQTINHFTQVPGEIVPYQVVDRNANGTVWQQLTITSGSGSFQNRNMQVVKELATGLNRWVPAARIFFHGN